MIGHRDSQKSKVYKAERQAAFLLTLKYGSYSRLLTMDEIREWVYKIRSSKWYAKQWGKPTVSNEDFEIKDGRGTRWAMGGRRGLNFPVWSRTKMVILHEIAHSIPDCVTGSKAAHDRMFCKTFLTLVRHELGDEAWKVLKQCFKEGRVKYTKPRKPGTVHPNTLANLKPKGTEKSQLEMTVCRTHPDSRWEFPTLFLGGRFLCHLEIDSTGFNVVAKTAIAKRIACLWELARDVGSLDLLAGRVRLVIDEGESPAV